jgi:FAD/FMN-containing dehydrogenase
MRRSSIMTDLVGRTLDRLAARLPGRVSTPGDDGYAAATAIWSKPVGRTPRAVVHCQTIEDVRSAIRAARGCGLSLSVRGGGHDWTGRALCDGVVIDLSGMRGVAVASDETATVSGGARTADVLAATDPLGLAPVTGTCCAVGVAGLTLGGGYGPLIGRFGLALDNLEAAEVVLADGRVVVADHENEEELFWALRGGGGNFGVVTAMRLKLHRLPSVRSGLLIYPFSEAKALFECCADIANSAPDELTVQVGVVHAPDDSPVVLINPTWCGAPEEGEAQTAPFSKLGTLLMGAVGTSSYRESLSAFDPFVVNGQRNFMETSWIPVLDSSGVDGFIAATESAVSPGCALFTHEFKGAATRVPEEATAFGLRREHVVVEILGAYTDRSDKIEEERHRQWARVTRDSFNATAPPGGYPNFLASDDDPNRIARSYGRNAERLIKAKRRYDPDNVFRSAIPLPIASAMAGRPDRRQEDSGEGVVESSDWGRIG